jgi:GT2 family glycosyltransferase/glycosyltransferase involved in cell wall biosynthesis
LANGLVRDTLSRPMPASLKSRAREGLLDLLRSLLPRRTKRWLKQFWDPNQRISMRDRRILAQLRASRGTVKGSPLRRIPVLCFSVFDWEFRRQRPQHLMTELALLGHPVFWISRTMTSGSTGCAVRPLEDGIQEVRLPLRRSLADVESGGVDDSAVENAIAGLAELRNRFSLDEAILIVQVPAWGRISLAARRRWGWRILYDCMDDWEGYGDVAGDVLAQEPELVAAADAVVVSSEALRRKWGEIADVTLVPNATDPEHFRRGAKQDVFAGVPRPIAGFFGALADWVDFDLLEAVARARPGISFVMIGRATVPTRTFESLPNVHLLGEKPYDLLPACLQHFDVCMIPFVISPLTRAMNPVKLYEYFSTGAPVVSTPLPEVTQYQPLVSIAENAEAFASALDAAIEESDPALALRRRALADENRWPVRAAQLETVIGCMHPKVSIVIVTWNNVEYTRLCLESVARNTLWPALEVIVVDNASHDGTRDFLVTMSERLSGLELIFNDENRGFATAANQGLSRARGERIVLLNNDVIVPPGWLAKLIRHLDDSASGLVVAVTNHSGNESRIEVDYREIDEMEAFASRYTRAHEGVTFDIAVATMYCVAMRRDTLTTVGLLDERFTIGMFEDDDYSHRVRLAGLRVLCAEDAFVHHFGGASFATMSPEEYRELFERNRKAFEEKWGVNWKPHTDRSEAARIGQSMR